MLILPVVSSREVPNWGAKSRHRFCFFAFYVDDSRWHDASIVLHNSARGTIDSWTVNGFTGTYLRMTAIMIRSNRIMHGRCHDNGAAKRGQIAVTQFRPGDWHSRNQRWTKSIILDLGALSFSPYTLRAPVSGPSESPILNFPNFLSYSFHFVPSTRQN